MNEQFCTYFSEAAAAWGQVAVGAIAAVVTILAVVAAIRSSRESVQAALAIAERDRQERKVLQVGYAKALAAAFVDELWENASRAYTLHNMASVFPRDEQLCRYLVHMQNGTAAPVLEGALSRLDVFEVLDAQLFARCATKIIQLRRTAQSFDRNISHGFWSRTVREIEVATSTIPAVLEEGLARAHVISGLPVTRQPPAEYGAIEEDGT